MGWESTLYTSVSFYKQTFNNKDEVHDRIEALDKSIKMNEDELRDLAMMTDPGKMLRSDYDDDGATVAELVRARFKSCMEILQEDLVERDKLFTLLSCWDKCHDKKTGLAIPPPDNWKWDDAFFDGDFVKTVGDKNNTDE